MFLKYNIVMGSVDAEFMRVRESISWIINLVLKRVHSSKLNLYINK